MQPNCLTYTLALWHTQGGYVLLRKSAHWAVPHVMHLGINGQITNYRPVQQLDQPISSLMGFDGQVSHDDTTPAVPMGLGGMVAGAWLGALMTTWWAIKKSIRKDFK